MRRFYAFGLFIILTHIAFSQNTPPTGYAIGPLSINPVLTRLEDKPRVETPPPDSIDLPFMDDFSNTGPYPDVNLWLDRQVFVNATMSGNLAPSIGIATFDAIGPDGKPYQSFGNFSQPADTLTSNYINLKNYIGTSGNRQPLSAADSVYMTFFLQQKGLGFAPTLTDSMLLEFRNAAGDWRSVRSFKGLPDSFFRRNPVDTLPPFSYYAVAITDPQYFHGKFQFRFRNFGTTGGIYELWHLDYVKIAPNRRISTIRNLDDMAFVEPPRTPLTRYTSMPWRHAKANITGEFRDSVFTRLYNHFSTARNPTNTNVKISIAQGATLVDNYTIIDGVNVPPSIFFQAAKSLPATLKVSLNQIPETVTDLTVTTEQRLDIGGQESSDLAKAAIRNDKVSQNTYFKNYFAYDDGTAEQQFNTNNTTTAALKFRLNVKDTIRGVQFFFPFIKGNATPGAAFTLRIWKDSLKTTPVFEQSNITPYYLTQKVDTLQGFTSYRLETRAKKDTFIILPAGDFFIGWQNVGNVEIPIGLDRNNLDKSQYAFQFFGGVWSNIGTQKGAIMVRPIVGGTVPQNSSSLKISELSLSSVMSIYPNPASDRLNFDIKTGIAENYEVSVFSLVGRLEKREILRGSFLDIPDLATGVYVLKIRNMENNRVFNHKIVVQK